MSIINYKKSNLSNLGKYDFIIIGGGIAGILLSYLLNNFKILLIEKGSLNFDTELNNQNKLKISSDFDRKDKIKRIFQIGGTGNLWAGRLMFLNDIDINKQYDYFGNNWPISPQELKKYYNKALKLLNIDYDLESINKFKSIKKDIFFDSITKESDFSIVSSFWSKKIERFNSKSKFFKIIKNKKNLDIIYNASVTELLSKKNNGEVTHVKLKEKSKEDFVFGKNFILTMGSIENTRLLLSSQEKENNNFIYNNNLGKYFMDHPTCVSEPIKLKKDVKDSNFFINIYKYGLIQKGISFNSNYILRKNLLNNYAQINYRFSQNIEKTYNNFFQLIKKIKTKSFLDIKFDDFKFLKKSKIIPDIIYQLTPKEIMPFYILNLYQKLSKIINFKISINEIVLVHHMEQQPHSDNNIKLSTALDYNNVPLPIINNNLQSKSIETANILQDKIIINLKSNNIINNELKIPEINNQLISDSSHHIGGTRMGHSPKDSVVNKDLLYHSKNNLYVLGSSVFPSSGHANPTLTIIALTIKLAEFLNKIKINE